ncbi:hypothetical protein SY86_09725 [Erwinia tracheiphila]|uniref:Uncharacterized protein n=1 Tax=Erwinia tracheiphila TaxID=65700 RepID=A0A0M2KEJ1_9GAMM|nr:hypothetical protein SY86_09725 [Erwinia tracheiphila]
MFLGILYFPSRVPIVKPMHTLISINMSELFEISGINILYIKGSSPVVVAKGIMMAVLIF